MKTDYRFLLCALGFMAASRLLRGEPAATPPATNPSISSNVTAPKVEKNPLKETNTLIHEEIPTEGSAGAAGTEKLDTNAAPKEMADQVVTQNNYIVSTEKGPKAKTRQEPPVDKFFRTGTITEHVGKKVTTKFWLRGDKGIMTSLSW